MKDIVVNLEDIKIDGNILDISREGNTAILEMISSLLGKNKYNKIEKDFLTWDYDKIPSRRCSYDNVFAFFSLSSIMGRKRLNRILRESRRILKDNGKIKIWDINIPNSIIYKDYNLKVILPKQKRIEMPLKVYFNPFRLTFSNILDLIVENKFSILRSDITNDIYYIEAIRTEEKMDEDPACIT